jgi:TonB family protein
MRSKKLRGTKLGSIFISYRRHDSEGEAGRLFDDLAGQFGENSVFMDVAGIEAGRDFRKAIDESVSSCGVLLALIGPGWLDEKDEKGNRRLDDPSDFVRVETASALKRDIPVIPVLLRGAKMPRSDQLPADLQELAYRNGVELTHARWRSDFQLLVEPLRRLTGLPTKATSSGSRAVAVRSGDATGDESPGLAADISTAPNTSPIIDSVTLQNVSRELAHHIGPIADLVVKRAASLCISTNDLYLKVAEEIESPQERDQFLRSHGLRGSAHVTELAAAPESIKTAPAEPVIVQRSHSKPEAVSHASSLDASSPPTRWKSPVLIVAGVVFLLLLAFLVNHLRPPAGNTASHSASTSTQQTSQPQTNIAESAPSKPPEPAAPTEQSTSTNPASQAHVAMPQRVNLSAGVANGLLISKVVPAYPPLARQASVQGEVILEADISKDGTVENLRLVNGHPLLVAAAIDAVKQWKYKPYHLNGQAVAVTTQVEVSFKLSRS